MSLFKCNIDREMVNTGTRAKPFISARMETRQYYCGPARYCIVTTEKTMENIGEETHPYYVKSYELVTVRLFGVRLRNKEQFWKFSKL